MLNNLKNISLQAEIQRDEKRATVAFILVGIVIILLFVNIAYLNFAFLGNKAVSDTAVYHSTTPSITLPFSPSLTISPTSCLDCLSTTPSPTITPRVSEPLTNSQKPFVKDYFIPLGSGTNQGTDWTDVAGVQAIVDFGQYTDVKEIRFEASVYAPTANGLVSVRLYNVSDKHPVWFSELTMKDQSSASLTSQSIVYDTGIKTYQVQMKNQLSSIVNLVQAKIHVILN